MLLIRYVKLKKFVFLKKVRNGMRVKNGENSFYNFSIILFNFIFGVYYIVFDVFVLWF